MRLTRYYPMGTAYDPITLEAHKVYTNEIGRCYDIFEDRGSVYVFRKGTKNDTRLGLALFLPQGSCLAYGPEVEKLYVKYMGQWPRPEEK